jgi:hypothetical protein
MTVKDLIAKLQTMPQDAVVIRTMCSDYEPMPDDEPTLIAIKGIEMADKKRWHEGKIIGKVWRIMLRAGSFVDFDEDTWDKNEGEPKLVDVVHFGGN